MFVYTKRACGDEVYLWWYSIDNIYCKAKKSRLYNSTAHNIEDVIYLFRDPFVKASKVQCKIKSFLEPQ